MKRKPPRYHIPAIDESSPAPEQADSDDLLLGIDEFFERFLRPAVNEVAQAINEAEIATKH